MGVELEGEEGLRKLMDKMLAAGSKVKGIELLPQPRNETTKGNDEIMVELDKQGRKFGAVDSAESEKIARAFADEMEKLLGQNAEASPTTVASKAFIAAMREYMTIVVDHINTGKNVTDSELSPGYAAWKQSRFGFTKPIGKATGQLLDNLNPASVLKNIKLIKR